MKQKFFSPQNPTSLQRMTLLSDKVGSLSCGSRGERSPAGHAWLPLKGHRLRWLPVHSCSYHLAGAAGTQTQSPGERRKEERKKASTLRWESTTYSFISHTGHTTVCNIWWLKKIRTEFRWKQPIVCFTGNSSSEIMHQVQRSKVKKQRALNAKSLPICMKYLKQDPLHQSCWFLHTCFLMCTENMKITIFHISRAATHWYQT